MYPSIRSGVGSGSAGAVGSARPRLEAGAAAGLVRLDVADLNLVGAAGNPLAVVRRSATAHADGVHLVDQFGQGQQPWHRAERPAIEVLIQARHDDTHPVIGQFGGEIGQPRVEELGFVDADDLDSQAEAGPQRCRVSHAFGFQLPQVAGDQPVRAVPRIGERLEHLDPLARDRRAPQAANQLLALAGEHAAGDHFDPSGGAIESVQFHPFRPQSQRPAAGGRARRVRMLSCAAMSRRVFSYDEALAIFPVVRDRTEAAVQQMAALSNGLRSRADVEARRAEFETACQQVVEQWTLEIESIGCAVKGPWLVDWDSGDGWFCWRYPEPTIGHFHGYEEGFDGRVPVA